MMPFPLVKYVGEAIVARTFFDRTGCGRSDAVAGSYSGNSEMRRFMTPRFMPESRKTGLRRLVVGRVRGVFSKTSAVRLRAFPAQKAGEAQGRML